ncbi:MAG: carboxypeptidase M32 [Thermoplasmatota archaeon]
MTDVSYRRLLDIYSEISHLHSITSILHWDQETYMPPNAVSLRAGQNSLLSGLIHQKITSREVGSLLDELENREHLDENQYAIIREIGRIHRRAVSIPEDLVREISRTKSIAQPAWARAREKNDFKSFQPHLVKIIDLMKKVAEHIGYDDQPYDALFDEYEPYAKTSEAAEVMKNLRDKLIPIIRKISESGVDIDSSALEGSYPIPDQRAFMLDMVKNLGYDLSRGRLDVTTHPFTVGSMSDVRITTRFSETDLRPALFSCIHEAGHALYEQGFLEEFYHTPLADSVSLGIHESQSRLWENIIGRSVPFWDYYYPILRARFDGLGGTDLSTFYRAINKVKPTYIRVEADEVTYNMHVLLRFELELELLNDEIDVSELPAAWTEKFEKYLGITPPDDTRGCLQDIHWSMGAVGYFPTYTLGNLYSAQFHNAMLRDMPDMWEDVRYGKFSDILNWLRIKIHNKGKLLPATDLIKDVTGESPNEDHFVSYIREKYGKIYDINL